MKKGWKVRLSFETGLQGLMPRAKLSCRTRFIARVWSHKIGRHVFSPRKRKKGGNRGLIGWLCGFFCFCCLMSVSNATRTIANGTLVPHRPRSTGLRRFEKVFPPGVAWLTAKAEQGIPVKNFPACAVFSLLFSLSVYCLSSVNNVTRTIANGAVAPHRPRPYRVATI